MDPNRPVRVLFICIGNSCRSPMAEAVARGLARDVIDPASAGLQPLGCVADMTRYTLQMNGYSIDGLSSKPITAEQWDRADLVINMSGRPRQGTFRQVDKVVDWDVPDPFGADEDSYQSTLEDIEGRVRALAERLRSGANVENGQPAE